MTEEFSVENFQLSEQNGQLDLKVIYQVLQSLNEFFPKDTSIALSDEKQYVIYRPSPAIDLKIAPGQPVKMGSIAQQTLLERQKIMSHVPANVFGIPYYGLGTPLYNEHGHAVGALTLIFPPEQAAFLQRTPKDRFLVGQVDEHFVPVAIDSIVFATSIDGNTYIHTKSDQFRVKHTLQELEWRLPTDQFVRCHRAFLVNVAGVEEIQRDFHSTFLLIMRDSDRTRIPVSQKYTSAFRRALGF
ncbi:LytTR family transcriptional regulator DNA-binding domain-containing protein [Fodinisporobacter ferrooxydans]|uniref:LytTR family transcriptional regulator DNA-binding domain-containing protein n=1 Tax=Fodinisporobacter ferrooxydans TaxID=2901836 RepID=A0ABY4CNT2_9BACL|nr:LytTR family transcriptional regulator DNA-binding domain-containing protein [Alicyclobacillaceae bacterium MYW30-H2]